MPDFERPLRDLRLHLAKSPQEKDVIIAYHKGLDQARKEIAVIAFAIALIVLAIAFLIG